MANKLLLFGGTGFVGSRVAQKAIERGFDVVVATRSGVPVAGSALYFLAQNAPSLPQSSPLPSPSSSSSAALTTANPTGADSNTPTPRLSFVRIDVTQRDQVYEFIKDNRDATAVISCVGLLTRDYARARAVNGDGNVNIVAAIHDNGEYNSNTNHGDADNDHAEGNSSNDRHSSSRDATSLAVRKFVYISAEPFQTYLPRLFNRTSTLKGYYLGKTMTERAIRTTLGQRGVILRPGFIYGTRYVPWYRDGNDGSHVTHIPVPLWWIGYPLDKILTLIHGSRLLTPPVDVDVVAEAAVCACLWANNPELDVRGVVDVHRMQEIYRTSRN